VAVVEDQSEETKAEEDSRYRFKKESSPEGETEETKEVTEETTEKTTEESSEATEESKNQQAPTEDVNGNAEEDEDDTHYLEKKIEKDHEAVIKQRSKSVRDAARMFQNVAEESAKAKPSTPQSVRRMPNRQSIQTDQPKASMTGVVRVAVPVPENFVEKKPIPQVIPPQPKSIYDDKYASRDHQRSSTYDNMPIATKETKIVKSEATVETKKTGGNCNRKCHRKCHRK